MFLIFFILSFFCISCSLENQSSGRFYGERVKKTNIIKRESNKTNSSSKAENEQDKVSVKDSKKKPLNHEKSKKENFIFPFTFNKNHKTVRLQALEEQKKMLVSVEPSSNPLSLKAGLSGILSIIEKDDHYLISISSQSSNQKLFFQTQKKGIQFLSLNGSFVSSSSLIGESVYPVLFYLTEENELTRLCFSIGQVKGINVVEDYTNHADCR